MVVINGHNIEPNSKLSGADLEDTTGLSYSDKNNMRGIEADSSGVKISDASYTLIWSSHSTNLLIGGNPIIVSNSGEKINLSNNSPFYYKWNDTDGLYKEYFEENFEETSTGNTIKVTKIVEDINDYDIVYKQPFADDDMVGTLTLDDGEKIDVGDYSIEWTDPSSSTTWKDFQPLIVTASGDTTMTKITFTGQDWVYYWDPSRNLYIEDFQDDSGEDPDAGTGTGAAAASLVVVAVAAALAAANVAVDPTVDPTVDPAVALATVLTNFATADDPAAAAVALAAALAALANADPAAATAAAAVAAAVDPTVDPTVDPAVALAAALAALADALAALALAAAGDDSAAALSLAALALAAAGDDAAAALALAAAGDAAAAVAAAAAAGDAAAAAAIAAAVNADNVNVAALAAAAAVAAAADNPDIDPATIIANGIAALAVNDAAVNAAVNAAFDAKDALAAATGAAAAAAGNPASALTVAVALALVAKAAATANAPPTAAAAANAADDAGALDAGALDAGANAALSEFTIKLTKRENSDDYNIVYQGITYNTTVKTDPSTTPPTVTTEESSRRFTREIGILKRIILTLNIYTYPINGNINDLEVKLYHGDGNEMTNILKGGDTKDKTDFKGHVKFQFIKPAGDTSTYTVKATTTETDDSVVKTITKKATVTLKENIFEKKIYVGNYSTFVEKYKSAIKTLLVETFGSENITDTLVEGLLQMSGANIDTEDETGSLYEFGTKVYIGLIHNVTKGSSTETTATAVMDKVPEFINTEPLKAEIISVATTYLATLATLAKNLNDVQYRKGRNAADEGLTSVMLKDAFIIAVGEAIGTTVTVAQVAAIQTYATNIYDKMAGEDDEYKAKVYSAAVSQIETDQSLDGVPDDIPTDIQINNAVPISLPGAGVEGAGVEGVASVPICFPAGTPVTTDQGFVPIETLHPDKHTIDGEKIIAITQTRPLFKKIVLIKKNALAKNIPSQDTEISNHHMVCYQGNMIQACELVKICGGVEFIRYNGETLYNVLLNKHSVMTINNLVCETLHPENVMAKIYGGNFNTAEKCKLLERLSTTVKPREIGIYNTLLAKMNGKNQDIYSELDVDFSSINIKKQNVKFRMATTPSKRF